MVATHDHPRDGDYPRSADDLLFRPAEVARPAPVKPGGLEPAVAVCDYSPDSLHERSPADENVCESTMGARRRVDGCLDYCGTEPLAGVWDHRRLAGGSGPLARARSGGDDSRGERAPAPD